LTILILVAEPAGGVRLAELVAAISLATDLGTGQPMEHALRTCQLSMRVAGELGLPTAERAAVYYVALLRFLGCTADAPETADYAGGDNIALLAAMAPEYMGSTGAALRALARAVGRGRPLPRRLRLLARAVRDSRSVVAHCEVGARLATRLGLSPDVVHALAHAYERWDGRGLPDGLAADAVPVAVRVVVVARDAVLWHRRAGPDNGPDRGPDRGPELARRVLAARRGRAYDPAVVDALRRVGIPPDDGGQIWEEVLAAEPDPTRRLDGEGLDAALAAVGDFADLRSRWTRGRSGRVAETAAAAGKHCRLPAPDLDALRRGALVADLGAVGVPTGIWDRAAPLGVRDLERVRLHPYLSERVLSRCTGLRAVAALAGAHHERLDGSGYHRGSAAPHLSTAARLLAVADVWTALREDRAHRPARPAGPARDALWAEARAGRLDGDAVHAVLAAAGEAPGGRRAARQPAGLTEREIEVLRLIARGHSSREVAARLRISPKTAGHHVAHIYTKIGVSTRPAAALFAMEHGLLGNDA
jgi:HD-GYP domain-containing protein (c-di-GMP phosphodiesterase class II)